MDQDWVVAVDMGYGHQRAAYPFRDIAHEGIITANTGSMVDAAERGSGSNCSRAQVLMKLNKETREAGGKKISSS
jgi:hypothetical protein